MVTFGVMESDTGEMKNLPVRGRPKKPNGKGATMHCCYGVCSNDSRKSQGSEDLPYFFLRFPKPCLNFRQCDVSDGHVKNCAACSKSLKWITSCKRGDGRFNRLEHVTRDTYICSLHFLGGKGPTTENPHPLPASPSQVLQMVNNEKQRYFQTQEKLKAITRIKGGERHYSVARSLGITCEILREWISSLAPVDWNRGVKAVSGLNHDLLDRALYTWFIQQIGMDLRPTKDALRKKAEIFSSRLYGQCDGIVSDQWIEKWQNRHHIKEKSLEEEVEIPDNDIFSEDKLPNSVSSAKENKENKGAILEYDFNLLEAVDSILNRDSHKKALINPFLDHKTKIDKLSEDFKEVDNLFEDLKHFPTEFRVSLLNTFGKEYGLTAAVPGSTVLEKLHTRKAEPTNDVVHIGQKSLQREHLPPFGPIERQKVKPDMEVFALKADLLGVWIRAIVSDIIPSNSGPNIHQWDLYRVKYKINKKPLVKLLPAKHLAYVTHPSVTLPVGTRVIAQYKDETSPQLNAMYAGIIAEPPKITNNQRYLVFFDDGYAQYVRHIEVFLVCESSKEVWKDIHKDSQEYIKSYLERYPERPMVKLQRRQVVKIEWNGSWLSATVLSVDASLVHVYFESDKRTEWIYRGSTRLAPLYNELIATDESRLTAKNRRTYLKRKHQPYVEYTTGTEEPPEKHPDEYQTARKHTKNTARKSTSMDSQSLNAENTYPQNRNQPLTCMVSQEGDITVDKLSAKSMTKYVQHRCCSSCNIKENDPLTRGQNPLRIPMLCGWLRLVVKQRSKRVVCYLAPCGRRLRSIEEVFRFLTRTKSKLAIDLFNFDYCVHTFSQFKPKGILTYIKDITYGKEPVPVCLVNNLNKDYPPPIAYSSKRFPRDGVMLNTDPEFLCGCDCEDNCQNKEKCQCQQLTVQATAACAGGKIDPEAGYKFRRLAEPLFTGVYECNSRCKCKSTCLNRVVQNGLQVRLQVFKTEQRGWGIRCLDDLPQGIFICIYAGQLSNEEGAQVDGRECGDEYQAELDHIEVVENMKEGYESGVEDMEPDESGPEEKEEVQSAASDDENSQPSVQLKMSSYDSDSDYDPPTPWAKEEDDDDHNNSNNNNNAKRRCNSRISSKDSDSSCANSELHNSKKTYGSKNSVSNPEKKPEVKNTKLKLDTTYNTSVNKELRNAKTEESEIKDEIEMKGIKNGLSGEVTSRKKSSAAIGNSDCDIKDDTPKPLRSYFGEEYCYIMDAKKCGNIGRYLNHACMPNVFVQNVFVDTHDLRFPWVAFFASVYIRAGTELTWDYNYDVGSVPGKVLHCYCGAKKCRHRLL